MKSYALPLALFFAVICGGVALYVAHQQSTIVHPDLNLETVEGVDDEKSLFADNDDPLAGTENVDWEDWRLSLSGKWVSMDGEQTAIFHPEYLQFGNMTTWPELKQRRIDIGHEMVFRTDFGYYVISTFYDQPDELFLTCRSSGINDLTSLTLYREGTPLAGSRKPIPYAEPTKELQALLSGIHSIKDGESKDVVFGRLGLGDLKGLEVIDRQSGLGQTDELWDLGIDDHWMLYVIYTLDSPGTDESQAVLRRFQVIRGYVDDNKWPDTGKIIYPYFAKGKVITENEQKTGQDAVKKPKTGEE